MCIAVSTQAQAFFVFSVSGEARGQIQSRLLLSSSCVPQGLALRKGSTDPGLERVGHTRLPKASPLVHLALKFIC